MTKKKSTPKRASNSKESYFDAERILDEKKVGGKWQYLIKWTGHDRNGKLWAPDWQPKDNCTPMLLKEWEQEKMRRKRSEDQKNKENHKKENQEDSNQEGNVMQVDDPADLQDDKTDSKVQMDIDKPDHKDDNLKQVLDKYCHNINDDLKRKSQSLGPSTVKKDLNKINSRNFPKSNVIIKIRPIQPSITSNSPIKSSMSILDPNSDEANSKYSRGKKFQIPSKSERVSLINLNKRGLEDSNNNNNNNSSTKRQKIEDVYDVSRKSNTINPSNLNEKIEESQISTSSNVKNKNITSQTNGSSNKTTSDGNTSNQQSVPIYNIPPSQISNQANQSQTGAAIHVNSDTIKALNSRKNSITSATTSASKYRPIAAKITPSPGPQYTYVTSVASVSNIVNVFPPLGSGKKFTGAISSNRLSTSRLSGIRPSIPVDIAPKNDVSNNNSQNQVAEKNVSVPTTSAQHTSYFQKPYVQSTSASIGVPTKNSNNVTQPSQSSDNQTVTVAQKSNKQPTTPTTPTSPTTNDKPNQHQSSNLQNPSAGSSTMKDNNDLSSHNHPFYQAPLEKLKEPTVENIKLWVNEWTKAKSLSDTLEKEKLDLIKEKNKYCREINQLRLEIERRPQNESETIETIKKCQSTIHKTYNDWLETQEKYTNKCKEYTKLESENSRLQNEYNKIKKIVMAKHSEVEALKETLNEKTQELKEVNEESSRLKADWSRIVRNGIISMREDYPKITRIQNSLRELINQRSNINEEINKFRGTISQEINKMKDDEEDCEKLYQLIENLKLQNKLQETSLNMAENDLKIVEESAKLMLDLKKLTVEEILGKCDIPSTVSYPSITSNSQASRSSSSSPISIPNLLNKNSDVITTSYSIVNQSGTSGMVPFQSQYRDNQGGGTVRMPIMSGNVETRNSMQGNVSTNTNILQARNLTTAPLVVARSNFDPSNLAGNPNTSRRNSAENTNSRMLSGSTTNTGRIVQNKFVAPSFGVRTSTIVAVPAEMNVRSSTSATGTISKVTVANPKTKTPNKSIQRMEYFCEWDLCKRSFHHKTELKKHLKNDHFNPGTKHNGKDKVIDCTEVKIEV